MTVSSQIIEVIEALCDKFGIAIDWTSEKIMPYLEQLAGRIVQYEIYSSIFWMALWWGIFLLAVIITIPLCKKSSKLKWDTALYIIPSIGIGGIITSALLLVVALLVTGVQVYDIVEAIYLPEKTILQFIENTMYSLDLKELM